MRKNTWIPQKLKPFQNLNQKYLTVFCCCSIYIREVEKETKMADKPVPIRLIHGNKKKGRKWPREFPDGGLSALVEDVFKDLKGEVTLGTIYRHHLFEDYHLEYADEVWVEDDGDWEMAVEYFDAENPDRLELTIKKNVQEEKVEAPPVKVIYTENQTQYEIYFTYVIFVGIQGSLRVCDRKVSGEP